MKKPSHDWIIPKTSLAKGCFGQGNLYECKNCAFLDDALRCCYFTAQNGSKKQTIEI